MNLRRAHSPLGLPVGWIFYAWVMLVICLAVTFPYDALHARFLLRLSERTGLDVHPEQWRLQLPAGVEWIHPSILVGGAERLEAEHMHLELKLSSVLKGQPVVGWSGRVAGREGNTGRLKGELSLASWSWKGPAQALGSVEQLDLSRLSLPLVTKGVLRGRFERRWMDLSDAGWFFLGEGMWHLDVADLTLEHLPIGVHILPSLTLSSLSGTLVCHAGTCRVESIRGESQDGMFSGEGELVIHDPLSNSHLALTLSVIMTEALKARLSLTDLGPATPGLPQKIILTGPLSNLQVS